MSSDSASVEVKATLSKGNAAVTVSDRQIARVVADGANGSLMANSECTRAQIVTMLYRLLAQ